MRKLSLSFIFLVVILTSNLFAQAKMMFEAEGPVAILYELKAIVVEEDGKVLVKKMPDANHIDAKYKDVDLKEEDQIIYINGKKVNSMDDFKKEYEGAEIGSHFELGIEREGKKFIVSIEKLDPSKLKMMIKTQRGDE